MPEDRRIFISYARRDGAELAERLRNDLAAKGFGVWFDTINIAGGDSWTDEIENGIDTAYAVLALLTPGSYSSRICRAEQLRALRKGKLIIPLLGKAGSDRPLYLEGINYRDITGTQQPYDEQLRKLLEDLGHRQGGFVLNERHRTTYVTAPPLPLNFVARPDEQQSLRQALIADADGYSIALTALEGMGGIGKTILAQALCNDEAVQQAFPDGVLWVTAGQEPIYDLRSRLNELLRVLGDSDTKGPYENELACINAYRTALSKKAALVVVDDVWRVGDVEPFLAASGRSCLLFTTRDASIAAALGAREHRADLLTTKKAQEVLVRYSGLASERQPPEARSLIQQCGHLPLALAMVGAMLRGRPVAYWKHVLSLLQNADLAKIRAQFPNYPHADLMKAIQVSVEALEPEQRRRYLALAILPEDMAGAPLVQQALWSTDEGDALDTAEKFISLSLAQREGDGILLHDLQLDYVRAQYSDREALSLIHEAMRLSANAVARDPAQFAGQMVGRLLPYQEAPTIQRFMASVAEDAPTSWLRPLQPPFIRQGPRFCTVEGHSAAVQSVAVSADSRRAVSASSDDMLKVWDVETGRVIRTLKGHSAGVNSVALSTGGRCAVSASRDKTLKVWDVETGQAIRTLEGHTGWIYSVAVSEDGRRAVSASADETLKVWDVETGRAILTLEGRSTVLRGVAVSADVRRTVRASEDQPRTGPVIIAQVGSRSTPIRSVALSADGRRAVSAFEDKTLKVWDVETGRVIHALGGHSDWIHSVAVSADGLRAISGSSDHTVRIWDVEMVRATHILEGHSGGVNGVALSADGRRAVSASRDHTLKVWDLKRSEDIATFTFDDEAYCCAFVDDCTIIAGDGLGRVHWLRLEASKRTPRPSR
jgi:hypothetical protein